MQPLDRIPAKEEKRTGFFWWVRFILFSAIAIFFLGFGVAQMIWTYKINQPIEFLMAFFSSSFIILISGTLLFAFVWKMVLRLKERKK